MQELTFFAYIDTGTGSLVIQSLIGVVAGIGVFGRRIIFSFANKLRGRSSKSDSDKSNKTK